MYPSSQVPVIQITGVSGTISDLYDNHVFLNYLFHNYTTHSLFCQSFIPFQHISISTIPGAIQAQFAPNPGHIYFRNKPNKKPNTELTQDQFCAHNLHQNST